MDIRNRPALKQTARDCLERAAYDPKKLVLLSSGAVTILTVVVALVDYLLQHGISNTGGLSGVGPRSVLETASTLLTAAQLLLVPFWQYGYTAAAMHTARGQTAEPRTLFSGFRRFGPLLRGLLVQLLIYCAIAYGSMILIVQVYSLTPLAAAMYEVMEPIANEMMRTGVPPELSDATAMALLDAMVPMILIWLVVYMVLYCIASYHMRLMPYLLLEEDRKLGAFAALGVSRLRTKGHRLALFKLDLSFWWYYALEMLLTFVCYGNVLLQLAGVTLPFNSTVSFFLFYALYLIGLLGLHLWRKPLVETTYALAYDALVPPAKLRSE